jgi:ribosomal protein S12 methylthiotransferase
MYLQEDISAEKLARKIGRTMTVLVDDIDEQGAVARSAADAPEIDGLVYIDDAQHLQVGEFVTVRIVDSDEHDLWGKLVD